MKYASIAFVFALAACGDSKPDVKLSKPQPIQPSTPTPDNPVAAVDAGDGEPIAVVDGTPIPEGAMDLPADADGDAIHSDPLIGADEHEPEPEAATGASKKPKKQVAQDAVSDKTEEKAPVPAKVDELSVQVLEEGTGRVVRMGDMVTLEYTVSYIPKPESEKKKDDPKKKGAKKPEPKKTTPKKSEESKSGAETTKDEGQNKDEATNADKPTDEKGEHAEAQAKPDGDAAETHDKSGDDTDKKPAEPKAVEAHVDPLKPIIVASTKSLLTPFTVKLMNDGTPKLIPGLVRGVEGLKVGTRARISIPAALAYGKDGNKSAGIPPETPVEIEVLVKDARE